MNSRNLTLLFFFSFFLFVCLYVCLPFLRMVAHSCWFCSPSFRLSLVITHTLTPWISFNLSQSIAKITTTPPPLCFYVINALLFCASNSYMRDFNQSLKKKYSLLEYVIISFIPITLMLKSWVLLLGGIIYIFFFNIFFIFT